MFGQSDTDMALAQIQNLLTEVAVRQEKLLELLKAAQAAERAAIPVAGKHESGNVSVARKAVVAA